MPNCMYGRRHQLSAFITFIGKQRVLSFHLFFLASCVRNRTANQFSLQFSLSWSSLHVKIISYRCSQLGKSNAADNAGAMCFNDFQATFENVLGFFLSTKEGVAHHGHVHQVEALARRRSDDRAEAQTHHLRQASSVAAAAVPLGKAS
jgi:hypothetical protein